MVRGSANVFAPRRPVVSGYIVPSPVLGRGGRTSTGGSSRVRSTVVATAAVISTAAPPTASHVLVRRLPAGRAPSGESSGAEGGAAAAGVGRAVGPHAATRRGAPAASGYPGTFW